MIGQTMANRVNRENNNPGNLVVLLLVSHLVGNSRGNVVYWGDDLSELLRSPLSWQGKFGVWPGGSKT